MGFFLITVFFFFFLAAFRILNSAILIMICLGVGLFGFILFGTFCASCTWISFSSFRFGKFSGISSNKFLIPFSFHFLKPLLCVGWHILYYPIDLICCVHLFFICLFAILIGWFPLFYLPDYLFCYSLLPDCFLSWKLNCLSLIGSIFFFFSF